MPFPGATTFPGATLVPGTAEELLPTVSVVVNQEFPPSKVAVLVRDKNDNLIRRWAEDEAKVENVLQAATKTGDMPGGHGEFSCSLARDPKQSWPDLSLFSRIEIQGVGGERLWTGSTWQEPQSDGERQAIEVKALGDKQFLEDDESVVGPGFIDRDQSRWGEPSLSRKITLSKGTFSTAGLNQLCVEANVGAGDDGVSGLFFRLGQVKEGRTPIAELWYRSGGPPIGSIGFDGVTPNLADPKMLNAISAARDDAATGQETIFEAHQTSVAAYGAAPASAGMTRLIAQMTYTESIPENDYPNVYSFQRPVVIGDQGLPAYGTWPDIGFLAKQMIPYIVEGSGLTTKEELLEDDGFVIPQAWFADPTTRMSKLIEVTKYGLLDWFVFNDGLFQYRNPGTYGRKWRLSPGSAPKNSGPDASRIFDQLMVTWQDVDGTTKMAGPPGMIGIDYAVAGLAITDERNPAVAAGRRRSKLLALNGVCEFGPAIRTGERFLEEAQNLTQSGEATITGYVQDQYGTWYPASYVQPGDEVTPAGVTSYRKITSVNYSHDSKSASVTLSAPPDGFAALEARFAAKLLELGFG